MLTKDIILCSIDFRKLEAEDMRGLDRLVRDSKLTTGGFANVDITFSVPENPKINPSHFIYKVSSGSYPIATEYIGTSVWFTKKDLQNLAFFADILDKYKNHEAISYMDGYSHEYFRETVYVWMMKENLKKGYDRTQAEFLSAFVANGDVKKYEDVELDTRNVVFLKQEGYCSESYSGKEVAVNKIEFDILLDGGAISKGSVSGKDRRLTTQESLYWDWLISPVEGKNYINEPPHVIFSTRKEKDSSIFKKIFEKNENDHLELDF